MSTTVFAAIDKRIEAATVQLRREVREEIRIAGMMDRPVECLPPPHDLDAEQDIVAAVLCEYVRPQMLAPLLGEHFFARLFGYAFAAADALIAEGKRTDVDHVLRALEATGIVGHELERELRQTAECTPFVCRPRLQQQAARVIELARCRALIRSMQQIDAELRVGALTFDAARERLHAAMGAA